VGFGGLGGGVWVAWVTLQTKLHVGSIKLLRTPDSDESTKKKGPPDYQTVALALEGKSQKRIGLSA